MKIIKERVGKQLDENQSPEQASFPDSTMENHRLVFEFFLLRRLIQMSEILIKEKCKNKPKKIMKTLHGSWIYFNILQNEMKIFDCHFPTLLPDS